MTSFGSMPAPQNYVPITHTHNPHAQGCSCVMTGAPCPYIPLGSTGKDLAWRWIWLLLSTLVWHSLGQTPAQELGTLQRWRMGPSQSLTNGPSHSPPWAEHVLGQCLMVWVLLAPDPLLLQGATEGMAATGQEEEEEK